MTSAVGIFNNMAYLKTIKIIKCTYNGMYISKLHNGYYSNLYLRYWNSITTLW